MCGISGIVLKQSASTSDRELARSHVQMMMEQLHHRGPDGQDIYCAPNYPMWLAHNRLSIIDLSQAASQPMASSCGRYVITYNGELYNYQSLQDRLIARGVKFATLSDTEVILQAYIQFGADALTMFRGMFAFFIWDNELETGFAARDPFGIKPFYYLHNTSNESFAFASELRALSITEQAPTLNRNAVYGYLRTGSVQEPQSIIEQISLMPAGHYLTIEQGKLQIKQYWSASSHIQVQHNDRHNAITHLRKALESTIAAHFVSDVPVGLFLSGGIDSTILLALATQFYQQQNISTPIKTFSIAFDDPQWDEGELAARTAEHFGADHTEWKITASDAQALFTHYLNAVDQPSIDGFNTFCVSKLAHDAGQKVVLSGLGGDELFAGYPSFKAVPKLRLLSILSAPFWPAIALIRTVAWKTFSPKIRRLLDALYRPWSSTAAYYSYRAVYSEQEAHALQKTIALPEQRSKLKEPIASDPSLYELCAYMQNQLLRDSDSMSMAWSLELRVPFVDSDFFASALAIAPELRLQHGKQLLIQAVPELPDWVVNQPKRGFRFPFDE